MWTLSVSAFESCCLKVSMDSKAWDSFVLLSTNGRMCLQWGVFLIWNCIYLIVFFTQQSYKSLLYFNEINFTNGCTFTNIICLYSWKFFPNRTCSCWLLQCHMASNNETVSLKNLWASNIAKSMMSEGNSVVLPTKVDQCPPLQHDLMNFQLQNFRQLRYNYNKSLGDWSL